MNYKISVILPIYNAKNYLERAIQSVINQTLGFENIELILVDDNSQDTSKSIIEKYTEKYSNIIPLYLEENSGWVSTPRNKGMEIATAEYIMFLDSDDAYKPDLCEQFYNTITSEGAELVSCNYIINDDISITKMKIQFDFEEDNQNEHKRIITGDTVLEFDNVFVWNKMFKKSIIDENNMTFKELTCEDLIFCIEYLLKTRKKVYLEDYYGYQKHQQYNSLSTSNITLTSSYDLVENDKIILNIESYQIILKQLKTNIEDPVKLKKINNNLFKIPIEWVLIEGITLENNDIIRKGLKELYLFEKSIEFESKLNNILLTTINNLVLRKKYNLAIIMLNTSKFLFNSNFCRKIYRILAF